MLITAIQDDENQNLGTRLKDTEEENSRLQRTISLQQSQIEKYKMLSQEANKKTEALQQEVTALEKVLQILLLLISKKGRTHIKLPSVPWWSDRAMSKDLINVSMSVNLEIVFLNGLIFLRKK